ncbi:hypothetical protein [Catenulispora sp. EB89]|uniref:hypothetical protein n=1 Tax=Catenulispora sp. EB89 TaxID=3156257 RepID=UPI0035197F99
MQIVSTRCSPALAAAYLGISAGALSCFVLLVAAARGNVTGLSLFFLAAEIALVPVAANVVVNAARDGKRSAVPARHLVAPSRAGFRRFPADFVLDRLKMVTAEVRILDTYSALLADQTRRSAVIAGLQHIVRSGGDVQIILLDAESWVVDQRSEVLMLRDHLSVQLYRQRLQDNLRELYLLQRSLSPDQRGRFKVRLIDSVPGVTCYQLDNRILTTFTPLALCADDAPQSWVTTGSAVGRFVKEAFNDLWEHGADLQEMLFCNWSPSADRNSPCWRAPYVRLDGSGAQYMAIRDPDTAQLVSSRDVIVADLPMDDGTRALQWYRPRPIHEDPLLFAEIELAFQLKYGFVDEGEVFEVVRAHALA